MRKHISHLLLVTAALLAASCQTAPPIDYAEQPKVLKARAELCSDLLMLLPEELRKEPAAQAEAKYLADTSYKAAAAIARLNGVKRWPGWRNNSLVNSTDEDALERGLCWHYQHDMYRELRRKPLRYFFVAGCVCKEDTSREHNCVYITTKTTGWPNAMILDPWRRAGRLLTLHASEQDLDDWKHSERTTTWLQKVYPEGHTLPIEHWATVRSDEHWNKHLPSFTIEGYSSKQGQRMYENIRRGLSERNGNPINY